MGDVVRFPQERCRWPETADALRPPAAVFILPVIHLERDPYAGVSMADLPDYDPHFTNWPWPPLGI